MKRDCLIKLWKYNNFLIFWNICFNYNFNYNLQFLKKYIFKVTILFFKFVMQILYVHYKLIVLFYFQYSQNPVRRQWRKLQQEKPGWMVPQAGAIWTDEPGEGTGFLPWSRGCDHANETGSFVDRCEGVPPSWGSPTTSRPASRRSRSYDRRTTATGWYSSVSWWAHLNPKSPGSAAKPSSARMIGPTSRYRVSGPISSWWCSSSTTSSKPTPASTRSRRRTRWARLPPLSTSTSVVSVLTRTNYFFLNHISRNYSDIYIWR